MSEYNRKFYAFSFDGEEKDAFIGKKHKIAGKVTEFDERQKRDVFVHQQTLMYPDKLCKAVTRKQINQMGHGSFFNKNQ